MLYGPLKRNNPSRQQHKGVSLIELAIGMLILSVLSIGVSSLVKTGVESQMSERVNQTMQNIGLNIVDDIRHDIRTANQVAVTGTGGNTLTLNMPDGTITYTLANNNLTRTAGSASKQYNDGNIKNLEITCTSPCFTEALVNNDPSGGTPRQIKISELSVKQNVPAAHRTGLEAAFPDANFSIRNFAFDVLSATQFQ